MTLSELLLHLAGQDARVHFGPWGPPPHGRTLRVMVRLEDGRANTAVLTDLHVKANPADAVTLELARLARELGLNVHPTPQEIIR